MLSLEEGKSLLKLARDSIKTFFENKDPSISAVKKLNKNQGVFVTLKKNNQLRGCIGFPQPVLPLNQAVIKAARCSAFEDPRFSPLKKEEVEKIKIEISVLTVPEEIKVKNADEYLNKISIGEDGLIIKSFLTSGLLLPQVFTEYNCSPKQALEMTCQKANLPSNAWKNVKNKIFKFQAQIFTD